MTTPPTVTKGTQHYAVKPPPGSPALIIQITKDAGEPGLLYTGKVRLETVD
ncbi:hypothetical protein ACQKM2_38240 [Streptomyces sp. NPDC004126]|uniref:hypothetical protein n=1 Tax=Streptomyces sp. NPDC004126 TaxID=3390695 RepID=UPI003D0912EA